MKFRTSSAAPTTAVLGGLMLMASAIPLSGQSDSLRRIDTRRLEVPLPGRAVIRDSARWSTLWYRFHEPGRDHGGNLRRHAPPSVDFRREMLIAVSMGSGSGCRNQRRYVQGVLHRPDSLVVLVGPDEPGPRITCMMEISPVDVVRIPRTEGHVAFRRYHDELEVPGPADWWRTPSVAELDRMEEGRREVYLQALALDPGTPAALLRRLALRSHRPGWGRWRIRRLLVERPEVRADPRVVVSLARHGSDEAFRLLLTRHRREVVADPETPRVLLERMIRELRYGEADPEVPRLLLENPAVRDDRELLRRLTWSTQDFPGVKADVCDAYLERWSRRHVVTDSLGRRQQRNAHCREDGG